jgi:hypothetical protein
MLFVIDKSLADALEEPIGSSGDAINAVELIAHAYRMGNHLVFAERGTLSVLKECASLSDLNRQIYAHMYNRFPQTGSYRKAFFRRVEVVAGEGILERYEAEECKVIRISADYASNLSLVNETVFLAENQDNIKLYNTIAKVYLVWSDLGRIHIRNEPRGGGGHTTAVEYQAIQNRKERLCLCISDSDRKTPDANMKNTAKALKRIPQARMGENR